MHGGCSSLYVPDEVPLVRHWAGIWMFNVQLLRILTVCIPITAHLYSIILSSILMHGRICDT